MSNLILRACRWAGVAHAAPSRRSSANSRGTTQPVSGTVKIRGAALLLPLALAGCNHAPAQDILGSFFPAWMLSAALGVLATICVRVVLGTTGISAYVPVPPVTFILCAAAVTLFTWLVWFGQ